MERRSVYRWECPADDVVWRGPADASECWCCGGQGRQVCRIADLEWDDAAA